MAKKAKIRPLAICVFRRGNRIFVFEGYDSVKKQTFYRPLGGRIEFGEPAADTVKRELMEEIGQKVKKLRYLGTLENIFTYEGDPGHEIVLVFDGQFADKSIYKREVVTGYESGNGEFKCMWKSLDFFHKGKAPVYPDGLLDLLG